MNANRALLVIICAGIFAICAMNIYIKYQNGVGLLHYIKHSGLTLPGIIALAVVLSYLLYALFRQDSDDAN